MNSDAKIFSELERFASLIPAPVSWLDSNGVVLGGNSLVFKSVGADQKLIIGKTLYEFYPKDVADIMTKNMKRVIQEKKIIEFEESMVDIETRKVRWWLTTRAPLFGDDGIHVVGIICTSLEITDRKESERLRIEAELQKAKLQEQLKFKKIVDQVAHDTQSPLAILLVLAQHCMGLTEEKIFETLKLLAAFIPINIYWTDVNNMFMGVNSCTLTDIGGVSIDDIIGKTVYDFYPYEMADHIVRHNNEVMRTRKILSQEEPIKDITTGKTKCFTAFKAPLYDDTGKIVGILGTSIDITTEKNAERLKLENETHKAKLHEQEKFKTIASQVAHDIRSPLASLSMIVEMCKNIPESERVTLRDVATGISDIANNLLSCYKKGEDETGAGNNTSQYILLSLALSEVLSSKKYQYKNLPVRFNLSFAPGGNFVFIRGNQSDFSRMISNLINNAVEAFDGKDGSVDLKLNLVGEQVEIIIQDSGKGIPPEVLHKINSGIAVTSGKKDGSGIGLGQVRDTLQAYKGKMAIESKIGRGTKITLTFPIGEAAGWIAEKIELNTGDIVIIIDDDSTIHGAWKARFEPYKSELKVHNFKIGGDAMRFIDCLTPQERETVFLLSDYELLNQELSGLQIIEQLAMQHCSILVTSHYNNKEIRDLATAAGIKVLPKQLASSVPIEILEKGKGSKKVEVVGKPKEAEKTNKSREPDKADKKDKDSKKVDMVIIDDVQMFADSLAKFFQVRSLVVDTYYNPKRFLENLAKYDKDTKICLDNDFQQKLTGFELAKQLHEAGYTNLYMLSGRDFNAGEVPSYLKVLLKGDMDALSRLV